jgi:uncharacterized glyoxalase superfamily protein PhnB
MAIKPIPDGYQNVIPYLVIPNPKELIDFAQKVMNAKLLEKMDTPDGSIMHAEIRIGDSVVMMGQSSDQYPPQSTMLHVYLEDIDAAYERSLKAGAVSMKVPQNQFYGDRTAMVKDTNDIYWNFSTHVEDVTPEEMRRRSEEYNKSK